MTENIDGAVPYFPKRSITNLIELPIFLNMATTYISAYAVASIVLYRSCIYNLHHTVDECELFLSPVKINQTTNLEIDVQKYYTYISTVKIVLENIFPAILSVFVGVWSDTYGRKPLLVWPLFGGSISGIFLLIFGTVNSLNPWWLLLTSIPFSLSGGYVILFTGAYSFIKDTSSPSSRTIRMLLVDASLCLGTLVGSLSSSYLIANMGYSYVLLFTATVNVITYFFVKIWIIESLSGAEQGRARELFNFSHLKDMLKGCFKQRPNKGRNIIILMAVMKLFLITVQVGCSYLEYLYLRNKLHWSLRAYTKYSAISTIIAFLGAFLGVVVIERLLRIGDITFLIIALMTAIIDFMIKAFALHSWQMYLSIFVSPFKGLPLPLINSYVSKLLPEVDIAKVFALLCAMESVAQIIAPIIFNSLYSSTLSVFPGAIYVLSAVMNVICLVMLLQVLYYSRNNRSSYL